MLRSRVLPVSGLVRHVTPRTQIVLSSFTTRRFQSTELPKPEPVKAPTKNGFRGVFRWTMRVVYVSAIGSIGFFIYRKFFFSGAG
jgi:hypothetical protein